jgi:hypothetical protein
MRVFSLTIHTLCYNVGLRDVDNTCLPRCEDVNINKN